MEQEKAPLGTALSRALSERSGCALERLYKPAAVVLVALVIVGVLLSIARAAVYKIRPYERGVHLRGGRFVGVNEPGWHVRIGSQGLSQPGFCVLIPFCLEKDLYLGERAVHDQGSRDDHLEKRPPPPEILR